jgi:AcrR family transcriptional regulator
MPGHRAAEGVRREQILKAAYEVASRSGLDRLTVRQVAAKARLSAGLILFHFRSKDKLIVALLDWLLATTTILHVGPEIQRIALPLDRLLALLRQEMDRLAREPRRIRLFFEYWVLGGRSAAIAAKMRAELARYREAFRPMVREVLAAEPDRFAQVTDDALDAVAVSFIKGCAVQSMIDPDHFDIQDYLAATEALVRRTGATPGRAGRAARGFARPGTRRPG